MDYSGMFGMYEMERAAQRIHEVQQEFGHMAMINDMRTDLERIGYVELVYRGWLKHGTYNGEFLMTDEFVKRTTI